MQIQPTHVDACHSCTTHGQLAEVLQRAIKLEHATLQPYLTAIYSLKKGTNKEVEQQIRWIAMEEMLHMCILSNLINALGGRPNIDSPEFLPTFPGPLPMGIGDEMVASLAPYSVDQVRDCFMVIEQPDDPIDISAGDSKPDERSRSTIGGFYRAVVGKLRELKGPLPGRAADQIRALSPYHDSELFGIDTIEDAISAAELVVEQGEGTSSKPNDPDGGRAHFYRFQELVVGRRLVRDDGAEAEYSYTGEVIPFDPSNVWPIVPDTRRIDLPDKSTARQVADEFARSYTRVLKGLHRTFNGHPDHMHEVVVEMRNLQVDAYDLVATPYPGRDGYTVGPTFELVD